MHSEPPRAASKKTKRVVPKFAQREIDRAYSGFTEDERRRFMGMAKNEIRRCFRRVKWANEAAGRLSRKETDDEPLFESTRTVSEAVEKLVGSIDRLDSMCHRAYQRVEPFVKMAANLSEERPTTVQIVKIGELGTSPAMQLVLGPPPPELLGGKTIIDMRPDDEPTESQTQDASEESPSETAGQSEASGPVPDPFDWG